MGMKPWLSVALATSLWEADPTVIGNWAEITSTSEAAARMAADADTLATAQAKADAAYALAQTYVDAQLGLRPIKDPARVAFLTNVSIDSPGAMTDNGGPSPVSVQTNDRILLFGQTDESENGPYVFNGPATPLIRTPDANSSAEMKPGLLIVVTDGTYADKLFELKTEAPITLGTTHRVRPCCWRRQLNSSHRLLGL